MCWHFACLHVCMGVSGTLELEVQIVVSCHEGAGNTQGIYNAEAQLNLQFAPRVEELTWNLPILTDVSLSQSRPQFPQL